MMEVMGGGGGGSDALVRCVNCPYICVISSMVCSPLINACPSSRWVWDAPIWCHG